jgi:hypothetical protein
MQWEEQLNEDASDDSVDFFENIVAHLETKNSKNATYIWYVDSGATKHVSRNKSSFKGLKNSIKT